MAIPDDLRTLGEQAHRELDAVHDFFEHTKVVWQSFKIFVDQGNQLISENEATGSRIDQNGLLGLAEQYRRGYLATLTFRQFVSIFEAFLFNFLYRLLLHNPWQFAKSQLEFEMVLRAADRDEIISGMLLKQLNELKYDTLREWFAALNKAIKLDCPSEDEIESLAEVKAARDILEHNAGIANDVYLRKAGKKARYARGDFLEIDDTYYLESWRLIKKVVTDATVAAIARLEKA